VPTNATPAQKIFPTVRDAQTTISVLSANPASLSTTPIQAVLLVVVSYPSAKAAPTLLIVIDVFLATTLQEQAV
jgi:hypothetical protein